MVVATAAILAAMLAVAVAPSNAAIAVVNPRLAACNEAWKMVGAEQAALDHGDASAWERLADAFISLSDASFDGPLSNALGDVASTPSNETLAALGTVCAKLAVTAHKRSVPRFTRFSFDSGVVSGLSPAANARANERLARVVDGATSAARRANAAPCLAAQRTCAYFVQSLQQRRCLPGFLCVRMASGLLASGANSGQDWVDTFAFDGLTGDAAPLSRIVPSARETRFIAGVNAAVAALLTAKRLGDDPFWTPRVTMPDVRSWLPQPDGIHIWFDKYAVAPGYFGVVHVVVPWPAAPAPA